MSSVTVITAHFNTTYVTVTIIASWVRCMYMIQEAMVLESTKSYMETLVWYSCTFNTFTFSKTTTNMLIIIYVLCCSFVIFPFRKGLINGVSGNTNCRWEYLSRTLTNQQFVMVKVGLRSLVSLHLNPAQRLPRFYPSHVVGNKRFVGNVIFPLLNPINTNADRATRNVFVQYRTLTLCELRHQGLEPQRKST